MPTNVFGNLTLDAFFSGGRVTSGSALTIDVGAFYFTGNSLGQFTGSTNESVADNAVSYVYLDASSSLIITSSYPNAEHIRLARVFASSGSIISIADERAFLVTLPSGSIHTHANKAELDLITDGDHDVRTDNPHQTSASQVGLGNVDNVQQIPLSQKGIASGVATLDSGTVLFVSELPTASIYPPRITLDQADYAPAGFSTAVGLNLTSDATRSIGSIASGTSGILRILTNTGVNPIMLLHSGTGSGLNQFIMPTGVNFFVPPSGALYIHYDEVSTRWRPVSALPGNLISLMAAVTATIASDAADIAAVSASAGAYDARTWKNSVEAATTASLPAYTKIGPLLIANTSASLIIDGRSMAVSESFFFGAHSGSVRGSSGHADFGIYVVLNSGSGPTAGPGSVSGSYWQAMRRSDFDSSSDIASGAVFRVKNTSSGSRFGNTGWRLTTTGSVVLNTTPLTFEMESSVFAYQTFTESAAWIKPEGVSVLEMLFLRPGAGGGGAGAGGGAGYGGATGGGGGATRGAPGGGGASFNIFYGVNVADPGAYTINIGAGGPGGPLSSTNAGGSGTTGAGAGGSGTVAAGAGTSGSYSEFLNPSGIVLVRAGVGYPIVGGGGGTGTNGGGAAGAAVPGNGGNAAGILAGAPYGPYGTRGTLAVTQGNAAATGNSANTAIGTLVSASFAAFEYTKGGVIISGSSIGLGGTGSGGTHGAGGAGSGGGAGGLGDEYSIFGLPSGSGGMGGAGGNAGNGNSAGAGGNATRAGRGENGYGGRGGGGGGGGAGGGGGSTTGGNGSDGGYGGAGSDGAAVLVWKVGT